MLCVWESVCGYAYVRIDMDSLYKSVVFIFNSIFCLFTFFTMHNAYTLQCGCSVLTYCRERMKWRLHKDKQIKRQHWVYLFIHTNTHTDIHVQFQSFSLSIHFHSIFSLFLLLFCLWKLYNISPIWRIGLSILRPLIRFRWLDRFFFSLFLSIFSSFHLSHYSVKHLHTQYCCVDWNRIRLNLHNISMFS